MSRQRTHSLGRGERSVGWTRRETGLAPACSKASLSAAILVAACWVSGPAVAGGGQPARVAQVDGAATGHTVIPKRGGLVETPQSASGTLAKADRQGASEGRDRTAGAAAGRGHMARRLVDIQLDGDRVLLNSFGTRTMPFDDTQCAGLGWQIVAQLSVPADAIHPLASDDLMHQMRVCAANGSVLITCYNGTATISLREPRPKDGCGG